MREYDLQALRDAVAVVLQKNVLFSGTIKDNLRWGKEDATEEECAEVIASGKFTKPFVVYVSGAWAPEGQRFSHASNIVERGRGSAKSKMDAITKAGGYVAMTPTDIPVILHEKLKK